MPVRSPTVAGMFYQAQETACRRQVADCLRAGEPLDTKLPILGGVVPHAGWSFSGPTAGCVFASLGAQEAPETVVLFGAVHSWGVTVSSEYGSGSWLTPLGNLSIDEELAQELLRAGGKIVVDRPKAHAGEHSIEVQLPFVKYLFPEARILPIATPPTSVSPLLGRSVARAVRELGRRAVALGSSDLTHYGPRYGFAPVGVGESALQWARENDARLLDLAVNLKAEQIVDEARAHHNACGAGAIAASIGYAAELGATRGVLLKYTTSHDVMPLGRPTDFVGYGAVVFL